MFQGLLLPGLPVVQRALIGEDQSSAEGDEGGLVFTPRNARWAFNWEGGWATAVLFDPCPQKLSLIDLALRGRGMGRTEAHWCAYFMPGRIDLEALAARHSVVRSCSFCYVEREQAELFGVPRSAFRPFGTTA